jgi:hypothetical protein
VFIRSDLGLFDPNSNICVFHVIDHEVEEY